MEKEVKKLMNKTGKKKLPEGNKESNKYKSQSILNSEWNKPEMRERASG